MSCSQCSMSSLWCPRRRIQCLLRIAALSLCHDSREPRSFSVLIQSPRRGEIEGDDRCLRDHGRQRDMSWVSTKRWQYIISTSQLSACHETIRLEAFFVVLESPNCPGRESLPRFHRLIFQSTYTRGLSLANISCFVCPDVGISSCLATPFPFSSHAFSLHCHQLSTVVLPITFVIMQTSASRSHFNEFSRVHEAMQR